MHYCNNEGYSAVHIAAIHNQYEALKILASTGDADINMHSQNEKLQTPLHLACENEHMLIVKLLL